MVPLPGGLKFRRPHWSTVVPQWSSFAQKYGSFIKLRSKVRDNASILQRDGTFIGRRNLLRQCKKATSPTTDERLFIAVLICSNFFYLINGDYFYQGGVFHIVFFKEMEIIWRSNPSLLLAREALILHLQRNTDLIVKTSMVDFWGQEWKDYVNDEVPAFLLLTDAENIPWKEGKLKATMQYFFRCFLFHCLAHGLNCVFVSGIEITATKVMGFYIYSSAIHKNCFMTVKIILTGN